MDLTNLVTDRTQADVEAGNSKGTYNATDLNRVYEAMQYIAEQLTEVGYYSTIEVKTDWTVSDIPYADLMAVYLEAVYFCSKQLGLQPSYFELPTSINGLNYIGANNIEKMLQNIDFLITQMKHLYAGTFNAGSVIL